MARRKFTRELKMSAVQLVNHQGYTVAAAAKSLGIDPNFLRGWLAKLGAKAGALPSGDGAVQAEPRRLRKGNARLWMERVILKKTAAFLAKEQT